MLYGNQKGAEILAHYLDEYFTKGKGVPFFILVGPRGIGKSSHAQVLIQKILGTFFRNDFLYLKDYSDQIGKKHTIPVELNDKNKTVSKSKKKKEEESDSFDDENNIDGESYPNIGVREMISRLQRAPFGDKKMVLIEDLQRASIESQNALLKALEEPLPQRVIIATLQQEEQILPTILSRAVVLHFSQLSESEMNEFVQNIPNESWKSDDHTLRNILEEMAMGRPGIFLSLLDKMNKNNELPLALKSLFSNLGTRTILPLYTLQKYFQTVIESGMVGEFVDGRIAYCVKNNHLQEAKKRIDAKKIANPLGNSGVSWERLFLFLTGE